MASCLLQIIDEADRMIDSMHQSWLPRVMAAAFPGEGTKGPLALLQRTQLQAVTAARYLVLSSVLLCVQGSCPEPSLPLSPTLRHTPPGLGWALAAFPVPFSLSASPVPRCHCRNYSFQPLSPRTLKSCSSSASTSPGSFLQGQHLGAPETLTLMRTGTQVGSTPSPQGSR